MIYLVRRVVNNIWGLQQKVSGFDRITKTLLKQKRLREERRVSKSCS